MQEQENDTLNNTSIIGQTSYSTTASTSSCTRSRAVAEGL